LSTENKLKFFIILFKAAVGFNGIEMLDVSRRKEIVEEKCGQMKAALEKKFWQNNVWNFNIIIDFILQFVWMDFKSYKK